MISRLLPLLLAGALAAADAPTLAKAGMDGARLARISERMKEFAGAGQGAGYVTLVARHGVVAHLAAVGWQDREQKVPMRTDSMFQVMSMTKPVTAAGIMMLVDEGRVSLNDPVERFIPGFATQLVSEACVAGAANNCRLTRPSRPVTIFDLLTHTSGLGGTHLENAKRQHTLAEVVNEEPKYPLQFDPGTKWQYSNAGIATLGRVIEIASGKKYEDFIATRIFVPLGMTDSHFFPPVSKRARITAVYTEEHGELKRATVDLYREGAVYPGPESGLFTTAADIAKFYQMMLNKGAFGGQRLLSRAAVEVMTTPHTGDLKVGFAPGMGYGLGWGVVKEARGTFRYQSIGTFMHGGAFRTYGYVDPGRDLIGVLMLQRTNGGGDVADEINAFTAMAAAAIVK